MTEKEPTRALRAIGVDAARLLGNFSPIVLSNRGPVEALPGGGIRPGAGGLVTALTSLASATGAAWVSAARNGFERELARNGSAMPHDAERTFSVFYAPIDAAAYDLHYSAISNPTLWFAHHYLWNIAVEPVVDHEMHRAWSEGYVRVNEAIAQRALAIGRRAASRPLFLTQDYQLYLAPGMIRAALPHAAMQHFVHVPWPEPRYLKVLPASMRVPILKGLLANDIVGLQTSLDVDNFLRCCSELMGLRIAEPDAAVLYGGRLVWVRAYPVSIDVEALRRLGESPRVRELESEIETWRPEKLIVRVDRTDPSKNILRGFLAYERLLEEHPEHHGRVAFWAFLQPSRLDVPAYRDYLARVRQAVERVNARFGTPAWQPTRLDIAEDMELAVAAFKSYDVLLVNPILDGMNLVAKEGPAVNRRSGVLVLSESAGAHEELGGHSLSINAFDVEMTAHTLHRALEMSALERAARASAINQVVEANDVARWVRHQLEDIRSVIPPMSALSHAPGA